MGASGQEGERTTWIPVALPGFELGERSTRQVRGGYGCVYTYRRAFLCTWCIYHREIWCKRHPCRATAMLTGSVSGAHRRREVPPAPPLAWGGSRACRGDTGRARGGRARDAAGQRRAAPNVHVRGGGDVFCLLFGLGGLWGGWGVSFFFFLIHVWNKVNFSIKTFFCLFFLQASDGHRVGFH